ncbi:MAG TPA: TonB-dependent receptor [Puia sp.]|nr:TonB-dependent receptor [Puia sp.]
MKVSFKQNVEGVANIASGQLLRKFLTLASVVLATFLVATTAHGQNTIHVKGRVLNESGQPVQKATVLVKGSTTGVSSDDNGNFEIVAPPNATLSISSVNYAPATIRIGGRSSLDIVLSPSTSSSLNEVVVVGYGTQKKSDVTGAVAKVTGATLQEVPTANFISELKGRTAGVDIVSNSATPGGGGQIRIRGNRSMSLTQGGSDGLDQPLVVLDGIPFGGSVNDISPDDILTLDILKDASATAIYGSRGSGGVILITTRRGRTGKAVVTYNSYYGVSSVLGELKVFNGKEYAQFKAQATALNSATPGSSSYALTAPEQAGLAAGTSTDWQKLIYQHGITSSNSLTVSGGNEGTQYSLGAAYYDESGIIPNQNFKRYSLRSTIDHVINRHLKIGLNSINTLSYSNTPGGSGVPGTLLRMSPLTAPYNPDGSVNLNPLVGSTDAAFVNPLTLKTAAAAILARTRRIRTFNSLYGEWQILPGLKYRLNVGLDYTQAQSDNYSGPNTYVNNNTSLTAASASVGNSEGYTYTLENILSYDKTIGKHRFTFTGLYSVQKDHSQASSFLGTGFPADYVQNGNLALANSVTANTAAGTNSYSERGLVSYMARLNYAFNDRFLLTATVRTDGASVLSPAHQYFTYPALGAGWNIMNEKFMSGMSVVSNLKLRGGWGVTSNQGVAAYSTLGALSASTYNFGQSAAGGQAAYVVTSLPNPNLHWESTSQTNIGVDFGFLNNRITGTIDVYKQSTKDIILNETLPASNGATGITANLGRSQGKGLEINLSTINIQTASGFTWSTDFNFSMNREKITALLPGQTQDIPDGWFVGQPLTVIYDVKKIGIWQTADSLNGTLAKQTSPTQLPGNIKVQDISGPTGKPDGKIDQNDRQILGNFQPQWEGGFTSRFSYKGFDLSTVIFARMGMKVLVPYLTTDGSAQGYDFFMQSRVNQLKVNYWTRSNPTNDFPRPDAALQSFPFASTLGYQNGSFIKMRSINLGYTIPSKALTRAGITSLRVYVTALNPFILYSPFVKAGYGPDPEGNGYGGAVLPSAAGNSGAIGGAPVAGRSDGSARQISVNANNPSTRQFNVGLNLKF